MVVDALYHPVAQVLRIRAQVANSLKTALVLVHWWQNRRGYVLVVTQLKLALCFCAKSDSAAPKCPDCL